MKKIYESPKAEVINFTAMEQLASLRLEVSLTNEDGVTGTTLL